MKVCAQRTRQSRWARSAVCSALLVFVVLQLGLGISVETWLPHLRAPFYAFKAQKLRQRIQEGKASTTDGELPPRVVVMLGTSRATLGFHGKSIEKELSDKLGRRVILFNFGELGSTPLNDLLNLERLLDQGIKPDLLLLEVFPYYLSAISEVELTLPKTREMGLYDRYRLRRHGLSLEGTKPYDWTGWAVPTYGHRNHALLLLWPDLLPWKARTTNAHESRYCDECGWFEVSWVKEGRLNPEKRGITRQCTLYHWGIRLLNFQVGGYFCEVMEKLLGRCQQLNIPTALVMMPEDSTFRQFYSPGGWTQVEATMRHYRNTYGVPIINAREWIADEHFLDAHHLLPSGAKQFTVRFGREAILPLLRGRSPQTEPSSSVPPSYTSP